MTLTLKAEEASLDKQVNEFSEMLKTSLEQRSKVVADRLAFGSIELIHKSTNEQRHMSLKLKIDHERPRLLNIKDKERTLKACFSDRLSSLSGLSAGNNNRLSTCEDSAA